MKIVSAFFFDKHPPETDSIDSEIRELSQRPYMVDDNASCDELIRDIRSNNTGRLVSKFLMSFFPDHS
jgi:hypothetical protein